MKNTIANKCKFSALYLGQDVFKMDYSLQSRYMDYKQLEKLDEGSFLELKPLSQISDEDAIQVAKYDYPRVNAKNKWFIETGKTTVHFVKIGDIKLNQPQSDFLRGNGYALDWTTPEGETITVKEMIEFGWIKIKE